MKHRLIGLFRAGHRFRTVWLLAALAVVCAAGYEASGGRLFSPAEPLPAGYAEGVRDFEPFFTPQSQAGGPVWMLFRRTKDSFSLAKPPGTVRVFIVGGSVADLWRGSEDALTAALGAVWPLVRFEVVNCGASGFDSSRERRVVAEVLGYQPDLIVLLSGNNQFREPLSRWAHARFRVNRQLRRAVFFRWLQDGLLCGRRPGAAWVSAGARLRNFERDVRWMLRACRARGVALLPVALPANVRDYAPRAAPDEQETLRRHVRVLLARRRFDEAARLLSLATARGDAPAIVWFLMGRAFDGLGYDDAARQAYAQALERDEAANRAWPSLNAVLRKLAAETDTGVVGLDAVFAAMDPRGMPGMRQFRDNCHWNTGYYRVLSDLVAGELWRNRARYAFLPGGNGPLRTESSPPGKTPADLEETLTPQLRALAEHPGDLGRANVDMLEGLAREGLFGTPCRLSFGLRGGHLLDWAGRDPAALATGLSECWTAFMLVETEACLRAGRVKDARGWLARAVKMKPALKQDPAALFLRWLLARNPEDAARWHTRLTRAGGPDVDDHDL